MIACYNRNVGDVLLLIVGDNEGVKLDFERQANVARVFREDTGQTVAWNIFEAKSVLSNLTEVKDGPVDLTEADLALLNENLAAAGFSESVKFDRNPKFVVAEIVKMVEHPDSDHLHICQVEVGLAEPVQIVCGAPNASEGLKTVAALPGSMMPSGSLIFPGKLRGVDSFGMLCSARELALPNAPQVRGIVELSSDLTAGTAFDAATMWTA